MVAKHPQLRSLFWAAVAALGVCVGFEFVFPGSVSQYPIPMGALEWVVVVLGVFQLQAEHHQPGMSKISLKGRYIVWGSALVGGILSGLIAGLAEQTYVTSILVGLLTSILLLASVELRLPTHRVVTPIMLLAVFSILGAFYLQGYSHLPGDDGTPAMTYARWLAQEQHTQFQNPIYPELQSPAYESLVAAEFPLHTLLASAYQFAPDQVDTLRLTNLLMLGFFLLSLLTLFVFISEVMGRHDWALVSTSLVGILAFFGRAYWGGHLAQTLGMVLLPVFLLALHRYAQSGTWKRLAQVVVFLLVLYPIHSLTWIVASSLTLVTVMRVFFTVRKGWWSWVSVCALVLGSVGFIWLIGSIPAVQHALPHIAVETAYSQIPSFLKANMVVVLAVPFLLLGGIVTILKKWWLLAAWFLVTWTLTQAAVVGVPFYATRFDEYSIVPLGVLLGIGVMSVVAWVKGSWRSTAALASLFILIIPSLVSRHLEIAESYLRYTPPYHPSTIYHDDVVAFEWIRDHTPPDALFIDVEKFGRFIPVISGRQRSMLGLEVYTAATPEARHTSAVAIGADYIVWDAVLTQTQGTYAPYAAFTKDFSNPNLFELVYENESVQIFKVL